MVKHQTQLLKLPKNNLDITDQLSRKLTVQDLKILITSMSWMGQIWMTLEP
jgi:hypothetical protein